MGTLLTRSLLWSFFFFVVAAESCSICGPENSIGDPNGILELVVGDVSRKQSCQTWQQSSGEWCRNDNILRHSSIPCKCLFPNGTLVGNIEPRSSGETLQSLLEGRSDLSLFRDILNVVGVVPLDDTTRKYTIFAPSNDAIRSSPFASILSPVDLQWRGHVEMIVRNHVLMSAKEMLSSSLFGETLPVQTMADALPIVGQTIGGAAVEVPDLVATNGVVHIVSTLLVPEDLQYSLAALEREPEFAQPLDASVSPNDVSLASVVDFLGARSLLNETRTGGTTLIGCSASAFRRIGDYLPYNINGGNDVVQGELLNASLRTDSYRNFIEYSLLLENYYGEVDGFEAAAISLADCGHIWVTKNAGRNLCFNDACTVKGPYLASNGVGFVVDKCLVCPGIAMQVKYTAENTKHDLRITSRLLQSTGWNTRDLRHTLGDGGPLTVLAPMTSAWRDFNRDDLNRLSSSKFQRHLRDFVKIFFLQGAFTADELKGQASASGGSVNVTTLSGEKTTISDGALLLDIRGVDGLMHTTTSFVLPKTFRNTVFDIAKESIYLSTQTAHMEAIGLAADAQRLAPVTVLFAQNEAFAELSAGDKQSLENVLKNAIFEDNLWCDEMVERAGEVVTSTNGNEWLISVNDSGLPCFVHDETRSCVVECDRLGRNGVMHVVDRLLLSDKYDSLPNSSENGTAAIGIATTPMTGYTENDCFHQDNSFPHSLSQCECFNQIRTIPDDVLAMYDTLVEQVRELLPKREPQLTAALTCSPINHALLWLSSGNNRAGGNVLARYILALSYYRLNGTKWDRSDKWLSENNECSWFGLQCDDELSVQSLALGTNNVHGAVPSEIAHLSAITTLDFSRNHLTGSVPSQIFEMPQLETLQLNANNLEGPLRPGNLSHSSSLRVIQLDSNKMSGTLPTEIGLLTGLEILSLSSNKISGTIPTEVGAIISLTHLDLKKCYFTGTVPTEVGKLTKLQELTLESNNLIGMIQDEICALRNYELDLFVTDCLGVTCPVPDCCTFCRRTDSSDNPPPTEEPLLSKIEPTLQQCMTDMVAADSNRDQRLALDELLGFLQLLSERLCVSVSQTTLEQNSIFNVIACSCRARPGAGPGCCLGENASIHLDGEQEAYLEDACRKFIGTLPATRCESDNECAGEFAELKACTKKSTGPEATAEFNACLRCLGLDSSSHQVSVDSCEKEEDCVEPCGSCLGESTSLLTCLVQCDAAIGTIPTNNTSTFDPSPANGTDAPLANHTDAVTLEPASSPIGGNATLWPSPIPAWSNETELHTATNATDPPGNVFARPPEESTDRPFRANVAFVLRGLSRLLDKEEQDSYVAAAEALLREKDPSIAVIFVSQRLVHENSPRNRALQQTAEAPAVEVTTRVESEYDESPGETMSDLVDTNESGYLEALSQADESFEGVQSVDVVSDLTVAPTASSTVSHAPTADALLTPSTSENKTLLWCGIGLLVGALLLSIYFSYIVVQRISEHSAPKDDGLLEGGPDDPESRCGDSFRDEDGDLYAFDCQSSNQSYSDGSISHPN